MFCFYEKKLFFAGSKFDYCKEDDFTENFNSKGPLLGPLVLVVASNKIGNLFQANVSFVMSRYNDPLFSMQKYEWLTKGWSRCSKECGGGVQRLILR